MYNLLRLKLFICSLLLKIQTNKYELLYTLSNQDSTNSALFCLHKVRCRLMSKQIHKSMCNKFQTPFRRNKDITL